MELRAEAEVDFALVLRALRGMAKQIPFASALALTRTAQAAQEEVRQHLGDTMLLRNKWTEKGVRFRPANKRTLEAEVGSMDPYMETQERGGVRTKGQGVPRGKTSSGKSLAIPTKALRKSPSQIVKKTKAPGQLLASTRGKGAFIGRPPGRRALGVYQRGGTKRKPTLRLMWTFKRSVVIKKRWPLSEQVQGVVTALWPRFAAEAVAKAITTARR